MNDQITSVLRSLFKIGGTYLITRGLATEETAQELAGGLLAFCGLLWSYFHHSDKPSSSPPALLLALALLPAGLGLVGCASSPLKTAYQVQEAGQITVDHAMKIWGDYVAAFHPGADKERQVLALYNKAKASALATIDASEAYAAAASSSSTNSFALELSLEAQRQVASGNLADLVNLMREFGAQL